MQVLVIGAGFTGLAAALRLAQQGHKVTIIEKHLHPGGLATGFEGKNWKWNLEQHYHHLFTSDWAIRNLAKEVGHQITFRRPRTSIYSNEQIYQFDSPTSLLAFPHLSGTDKVRTATVLGLLRLLPWQAVRQLESIPAASFLKQTMGQSAWKLLWKPLFDAKFGKFANKIPASWFWARIKKRSAWLGYPKGGFQALAESIAAACQKRGAQFVFNTGVVSIARTANYLVVKTDRGGRYAADAVICTLPTPLFCKITKGLPKTYTKRVNQLKGLGAVNLVLVLKKRLLEDKTYWLNINEAGFPFLAVVEHTNFMDKRHYGGNHIVYIGNYLPPDHPYFRIPKEELLKIYDPFLRRLNPTYRLSLITYHLFSTPFAQPIIPLNYSKVVPPLTTPIPGLFLANIQQVYPWDRGTNYAVELGEKAAKLVNKDEDK